MRRPGQRFVKKRSMDLTAQNGRMKNTANKWNSTGEKLCPRDDFKQSGLEILIFKILDILWIKRCFFIIKQALLFFN